MQRWMWWVCFFVVAPFTRSFTRGRCARAFKTNYRFSLATDQMSKMLSMFLFMMVILTLVNLQHHQLFDGFGTVKETANNSKFIIGCRWNITHKSLSHKWDPLVFELIEMVQVFFFIHLKNAIEFCDQHIIKNKEHKALESIRIERIGGDYPISNTQNTSHFTISY